MMSSVLSHGCCATVVFAAMVAFAAMGCGPHSAAVPKNTGAEARNAETEKKPRKQQPRLIAPPPAYGNKIVLEASTETAARAGDHIDG